MLQKYTFSLKKQKKHGLFEQMLIFHNNSVHTFNLDRETASKTHSIINLKRILPNL